VVMVTDLMIDGVRVLPGVPGMATAPRQIWYGVLQAALETEFGLRQAGSLDPGSRTFAGASFAMGDSLEVLSADGSGPPPAGADPALLADVEAESLVVVPGDVTSAEGWWTVDPTTGVTRAMLSPGLRGYRDTSTNRGRPAGTTLDSYYKAKGAGSQALRRGTGRRPHIPGNYHPGRTPPAGRCSGASEYISIVGCVSLPTAIVLNGATIILVIVVIEWARQVFWCGYVVDCK
jgi:hypothetical protein